MSLQTEHQAFAKQLAKDPYEIMYTMNPQKVDALHATIGIVGEIGEIVEGYLNKDLSNLKEELGDIEFYLNHLRNALGLEYEETNPSEHCDTDNLVIAGANLLDQVKKWVIYDQDFDTTIQALRLLIIGVQSEVLTVAYTHGLTRTDILKANIIKLNKRYPGGYSDQNAKARLDKQQESST